ncbi:MULTISPECIES: hypothetical protein [Aquimarina]|uniref:hypothetical protein n=1 Tax=Aquimarina TaxID=290174 RepID=UPI000945CAEC|nr:MULTISPECIES: hypothetical protein [Aquimarina]
MIKNILNVEKIKVLKKEEQKSVNAGSFASDCLPEIRPCRSNDDCCTTCNTTGIFKGLCAF